MMMYRIALFFAIVSAIVGAMGGVMSMNEPYICWYDNGTAYDGTGPDWYNDDNPSTSWFSGANIHPIQPDSVFSEAQVESIQNYNGFSETTSSETGSYSFGISSMMSIALGMVRGVFMIYPELDKVLRVDDGAGNNLFAPFLMIIQIGIWAIYLIGMAQLYRNANYRYNY